VTLAYDLFWSFRSPYSYLLTPRLLELERAYDARANVRPVYPIAVRMDGFFRNANPLWLTYLVRDVARTAQMLGMPFSWPHPDPVVMDLKSGEVPEQQPYISRLTKLGVAAAERGKGLEFLKETSAVIFGGTPDWHLGDHLARAAGRPRPCRARSRHRRHSRTLRGRHRRKPSGAEPRRPLGRAADGVRERTVLRTGPLRDAAVAAGAA